MRLISSRASTSASIIERSLTAIGPVCECRMPTTIGRRTNSQRSRVSQPPTAAADRIERRSQVATRPALERLPKWTFIPVAGDGDVGMVGDGGVAERGHWHPSRSCNLCPSFPTGRRAGEKTVGFGKTRPFFPAAAVRWTAEIVRTAPHGAGAPPHGRTLAWGGALRTAGRTAPNGVYQRRETDWNTIQSRPLIILAILSKSHTRRRQGTTDGFGGKQLARD